MNRPLSPLEHVVWLIDQSIHQNFVMIARLSGFVKDVETHLRLALDLLQKKYPPLNCKILGGEKPVFDMKNVPQIPLDIMARKGENHWIEIAEQEMKTAIPWALGPLTRANLLISKNDSTADLMITFCHVVADATSGVMFMQNLLTCIQQMGKGETVNFGPAMEPLPAPDNLIKKDLQFQSDVSADPFEPAQLMGDEVTPPDLRTTRVIQKMLSAAETKKLVTRSKQEKTSVHGALCAAMMQAVAEQIRKSQDSPAAGPLYIGCVTPVDMRRHLTMDVSEYIGDFISQAIHYQPIDENSSLWDAARSIIKSLKQEMKAGNDIKGIQGAGECLNPIPNPRDLAISLHSSSAPLVATNLGRLDIPLKFGKLNLEAIHFTVGINADGKNGFGISITTFRDQLTINFLYADPYISKNKVNELISSTMNRLLESLI
jgi:Phthiocerol/phthiodiolone dimycocerosyl transferase C-terminus